MQAIIVLGIMKLNKTIFRTLAALIIIGAFAGCDSDDDGGPQIPPPPPRAAILSMLLMRILKV